MPGSGIGVTFTLPLARVKGIAYALGFDKTTSVRVRWLTPLLVAEKDSDASTPLPLTEAPGAAKSKIMFRARTELAVGVSELIIVLKIPKLLRNGPSVVLM